MALNIKNEEAHRLATRLAEIRGTSLTEAVTTAIQETLARTPEAPDAAALLAEVAEIQRFVAELPDRDPRSPEEILGYDEQGLIP
ncbi:MAG: protein transcription factor [Gemmatimonadales bacterium]|nr:MAG: protein transcription factor [Gemmatimonadales bacterium]